MPREKITFKTEPEPRDASQLVDAETAARTGSNVHVGWRNGEVTIGVDITMEEIKRIATPNPDMGWGLRIVNTSDPLDRRELNKLIATLRRARDKAYGADA